MADRHIDKKSKVEEDGDEKPEIAHLPAADQQIVGAPAVVQDLIADEAVPPPKPNPQPPFVFSFSAFSFSYNWHTFYNDPNLDLVLKSPDSIYFRASKHALKRCSPTFDPDRVVTPAEPITIPFTSNNVALFLSQLSQPDPPIPAHTSFDAAHKYLQFILRFAPNHATLVSRARSAFKDTNAKWPFDYLIHVAGSTGDIFEARWALEQLDEDQNEQWDLIGKPAELVREVGRLPKDWQGPIWKLLMRVERDWDSGEKSIVLRWPSPGFARRFELD